MGVFGYIKAYKPELRLKEWEMYKAVYCTLYKHLGKNYGVISRFTLSYDFTFLCLLNMSLSDCQTDIERKKCAFNPLKKCNYCKNSDDFFDFPSAAAMIMVYYKLLDNTENALEYPIYTYCCRNDKGHPYAHKRHGKVHHIVGASLLARVNALCGLELELSVYLH